MKKEKYLQIFNYLLEFSKLRSNPVRDIESSETQYPDKIWFADIPHHELFDCITNPNFDQDADYWIKINKPKGPPQHPTFPKLPDNLEDWIEKDSLIDENGTPYLKPSIIKNGKTLLLSDHPLIEKELQEYLNNKWIDDLDFYKTEYAEYEKKLAEFEKLNETYKHFFSIYNKAQQFGEEYELVAGVGLLNFKENDNTPRIYRHILTSKVEISFEFSQRESFVRVSPSIENDIQIETDAILDLVEQFESQNIIEAEKKVVEYIKEKNISDNPFDKLIKDAIQIFSDRVRSDGQFKDELKTPKEVSKKPVFYFAPALLLRKRNTRSFTALYEKIIKDIENAADTIDIPVMNDIIGYSQQPDVFPYAPTDTPPCSFSDETIYFPKKYNDEQIEIIEKAKRNSKVLVQGPPGTGKSHTIANLICHLLANGKKVLVTAYTKRALEVLKNQLPEEFQKLTVNLLSGDSTSIQDLEASVNAINDELSRANINSYKNEIEQLNNRLFSVKEEKAKTKNELIKAKEKDTRQQTINKYYQGTLMEIAEEIEKEFQLFSWYKDEFNDINKLELITEIKNFFSLTRDYQSIDCSTFDFIIPQKEKILSLEELKQYRSIANDLLQKYASQKPNITIECKDFQELRNLLETLHKLLLKIENNVLSFKTKLISDYPHNLSYWKDKTLKTNNLLADLPENKLKVFDRSIEITYPNGKSLIQLKNDAQTLLAYLKEGNSLSGMLFSLKKAVLPKNIKEKLYFIEAIKINGSPCDTVSEFEAVLADIKIKQDFEELKILWGIPHNSNPKYYVDKAKFYKQLKDETEALINTIVEAHRIKARIESISSLRIQGFESKLLVKLLIEADHNFLLAQMKSFQEKIVSVNKYLLTENIHPIANSLIKHVEEVDPDKYEQQIFKIDDLKADKEKHIGYKKLQAVLQQDFPISVNEIIQGAFEPSNLQRLERAIYRKQASTEVTKLLENDYEERLTRRLADLDKQEEKLIVEIASKKAWLSVLEGLTQNFSLRQHLQAWVQAVKKIGKTGRGKRALKFRKEAQHQMEQCKDSVPCWIMPLYKVAETISPETGMYDFVIIDEASQLGADAIFLLYISKNIIIVGDDKQVSPEYIGVDANTMTPHINRYLQNIPFANYYGTEFSFFEHAERFCNGITVLREHFRCMPEIIEFSNRYFYAPSGKGLYPLKQYSENRLEPLKTVYCPNGYIDGLYQNISNKIETEGIANTISELVKDDRYKGKTFGIIALQGNKQAALIESLLLKKIGEAEFHKRKIVCGNSASFQGDERDIIFLSLITAHNHNRTALVKPEDERRFNVAASRAKEQVWLFHSVQLEDLSNTNDLRYKLLDHFLNYKPKAVPLQRSIERSFGTQPEPFESWFEVDVFNDIIFQGHSVIPQYEVGKGKYRIDLVAILPDGTKIAIECYGDKFHGAEQYQNDLMRQKVLERCGWRFFTIRGAEYYSNRKKALEPLWKLLCSNNIQKEKPPITNERNHSDKEGNKNISIAIKQPEIKRQIVSVSTKKNEQPNFFRKESQTAIDFVEDAPSSIKTNAEISSDSTSAEVLVFTSHQNVYKIQKKEINSRLQVLDNIDFEHGEKPIYKTLTKDYSGYLIVAFKNGKVGKITMKSYETEANRKKMMNAFNNESELIFIEHIENDIDLVALSSIKKVVIFNTNQINPVESRTTKGVQVLKPKDGSVMIKVKKLDQVNLKDPDYYRKEQSLNAVGFYLKQGDKI